MVSKPNVDCNLVLGFSGPAAQPLYGGRMTDMRRNEVISAIGRRIESIKKSNDSRPNEADEETDPYSLKTGLT